MVKSNQLVVTNRSLEKQWNKLNSKFDQKLDRIIWLKGVE